MIVTLKEVSGGGWFGATHEIRWKAEIATEEMEHLGESGSEDVVSVYDLAHVTVTVTDVKGNQASARSEDPICLHTQGEILEIPDVWYLVEKAVSRI